MKTLLEFYGSTGLEARSRSTRDAFRRESCVRRRLRDIDPVKRLTPQEEIELAAGTRNGDREVREQLIKANLPLVIKTARVYEGICLPLLDRISEGNIGPVRAVEKFDPTKGANLSGYGALKQARTRFLAAVATALVLGFGAAAYAQLPPELVSQFNRSIILSVDASTVLAGGPGVKAGSFSSSTSGVDTDLNISKFGGDGDVGDPRPLGLLGIGWQPRLEGNIGYVTYKNHFDTAPLAGDENKYTTIAVDFGGGARFWFGDHLSFAPTVSGIYGHTKNGYTAVSSFSRTNYAAADQAGLINWAVDTWTIVPGAELSYQWTWRRVTFTLSSTFSYFHTEDFNSSSSKVSINSDSETWENKLDVDVPIGVTLLNREVHVGGYYSWTGFYGDLREGFSESQLEVKSVNEIHGRVVLDVLNKLWKVKWLGVGGSYFWGNQFTGWSVGVDAAFKF